MLGLYFWGIVLLTVLDQGSKLLVLRFLKPVDTFPLWNQVFHLTYCENRGAAFGILQNKFGLFFVTTMLVLICATIFMVKHRPKNLCLNISLTLLIGGALGNFVDRMCRGFVVDFLDFRLINFAIFNLADCFVVCGAFLLAFYVLFMESKEKPKRKEEE